MIKNLIFDFGDVFINLNASMKNDLQKSIKEELLKGMQEINKKFEKGQMSISDFLNFYATHFPQKSNDELIALWNSILLDFPLKRLTFLETITADFRIFLLSNTNEIHIDCVKNQLGFDFYNRFENCFEKIYYSFEVHCRKPDVEIFELVLKENNLNVAETLFVDDTLENIVTAIDLGIHTWHINPKTQQVFDLFSIKENLFLRNK